MSHRWFASLGIVVVAAASAAGHAQSPAARTGSRASARTWTAPRTPWGEPDLQGVWSYATLTPLERPDTQAGKEVLKDEEVAALDQEARTGADRRDGPPETDL